jgi:phosphoglycerol transferase MdoB-like AlkP superfamily enzyme
MRHTDKIIYQNVVLRLSYKATGSQYSSAVNKKDQLVTMHSAMWTWQMIFRGNAHGLSFF